MAAGTTTAAQGPAATHFPKAKDWKDSMATHHSATATHHSAATAIMIVTQGSAATVAITTATQDSAATVAITTAAQGSAATAITTATQDSVATVAITTATKRVEAGEEGQGMAAATLSMDLTQLLLEWTPLAMVVRIRW